MRLLVKDALFGQRLKQAQGYNTTGEANRMRSSGYVWRVFEAIFLNYQMLQDIEDIPEDEGRFTRT